MCSKIFSPLTYLQSFLLRSRSFYNKYKIVTCTFFLVNRYRKNEQRTVIAVLSFDDSHKRSYELKHSDLLQHDCEVEEDIECSGFASVPSRARNVFSL